MLGTTCSVRCSAKSRRGLLWRFRSLSVTMSAKAAAMADFSVEDLGHRNLEFGLECWNRERVGNRLGVESLPVRSSSLRLAALCYLPSLRSSVVYRLIVGRL